MGKLCTDVACVVRRNITKIRVILGILSFSFEIMASLKARVIQAEIICSLEILKQDSE